MSASERKRGPGRPAFEEGTARTIVFTLKLSDAERAMIRAAAERAGKPVTQWAREALLSATASDGLYRDGEPSPRRTRHGDSVG